MAPSAPRATRSPSGGAPSAGRSGGGAATAPRACGGPSASGVAVHHLAGWHDIWVRDAVLWFGNLTTAQRLTIGPWWHTVRGGVDLAAEYLRWFDYWLKGTDTGVMDEPPIRYFTMSAKP